MNVFSELFNHNYNKIVFLSKSNIMETKEHKVVVHEFASLSELPESDQRIVLAAREASKRAYAPYSGFNVGAAVLLENNEIITGNNQENAASPTGLCAERVALFYANATYPDSAVISVAVTAGKPDGLVYEPVKPCGSCRQALIETEIRYKKSVRIILDGKQKIQVFDGVDNLLPFAFKPESLD